MNSLIRAYSRDKNLAHRNILLNCCCPGLCRTDMGNQNAPKSADEGAILPFELATLPDTCPFVSGRYFSDA